MPSTGHMWNLMLALPFLKVCEELACLVPYKLQGFFCNDNEIRFPDVPDTVPPNLMYAGFWITSICLIVISEISLIRHLKKKNENMRLARQLQKFHPMPVNVVYFLLALAASILANNTILALGKRTCSRLRPNFLAVCKPNLTLLCPPGEFAYIQDYECMGSSRDDEYFAFPSGHSSQSVNFAVFIIYYVQKRFKFCPLVKTFVQFLISLMTLFICLSRVRDHKHRLTDVAGGAVIGLITGLFLINYVLHNFRPNRYIFEAADENGLVAKEIAPPTVIISGSDQRKRGTYCSDYGSLNNSSTENIFEAIDQNMGPKSAIR